MNLEPMNATDAVNVLKFLERQIESGFGSPEATASLQRVVNHLTSEVRRLVSGPNPALDAHAAHAVQALSFRDQAMLAALPVAGTRVPYVGSGDARLSQFVSDISVLAAAVADELELQRK
jgi:hypothetical protein